MAIDVKKYSAQLRKLCEDHYLQNISYIEFRIQRNDIFERIQAEQDVGVGTQFQPCHDPGHDEETGENHEYIPIHQD